MAAYLLESTPNDTYGEATGMARLLEDYSANH
jgi:hypothetical protein